jgi:hypothetical protein
MNNPSGDGQNAYEIETGPEGNDGPMMPVMEKGRHDPSKEPKRFTVNAKHMHEAVRHVHNNLLPKGHIIKHARHLGKSHTVRGAGLMKKPKAPPSKFND